MAATSYSLSYGADQSPDEIAVGTSVPGAGDVEVRINLDANTTAEQVILILEAFIRRLEDGRLASKDLGTI